MNVSEYTIEKIAHAYKNKEISPAELVEAYRQRIKDMDPRINACLNVFDTEIQKNEAQGAYAGIPIAVKDNMVIEGEVSTAGSKILKDYRAPYTATAVQKILDAGMSVIGKTNLDEFAMGSSTENSAYFPTKNPWDITRVPGGSSGGSAAAVAAGFVPAALGSDTGGSIRQPASFCGVVGLKPTYGRVSRHGLMAMASSLDQIGPITRSVKDAGILLNILAGRDAKDATTIARAPEDFIKDIETGIKGLRIGIPKEFFGEGLDAKVEKVIQDAIADLQNQGAEIVEVSLPHSGYALPTYYIIMPVEVASNLERYDGIKYGLSMQDNAKNLLEVYLATRREGFGPEVKRRIILGTYASSAGYYDAYYKKATAVQQVIRDEYKKVFEKVDVIAGPTSPTVAFRIGSRIEDPLEMYKTDIYTVPANIAGIPAISIPAGFVDDLPVGLQLQGAWWDEARLLRTAYTFEQLHEYHQQVPQL